jgi:hypothetical protein
MPTGDTLGRVVTPHAEPGTESAPVEERAPGFPRRRFAYAFAALTGGALLALAGTLAILWLFVALSWPHQEPLHNPQLGINFSCRQAEYLLLEVPGGPYIDRSRPDRPQWCAQTLGVILRGTGARDVRLSVEWATVEPQPGVYDFRVIDAMLAEAQRDGARVLLTVGVKAQRSPEFYIPDWVLDHTDLAPGSVISDDPYLHDQAIAMVRAVVGHTASSPAIDSWEAGNEPYVASNRSNGWTLSRQFVQEVVAAIHANDPQARPVVINQAQHFVFNRRWQHALADGDVLAASIYPFRNYDIFGHNVVVPILELGPLTPNYAAQGRAAKADGKPFWITEMQAEPWTDTDIRLITPAHPSPNLTHENFARSIGYARRTGASRVYLWGAEWWYYGLIHNHDASWWDQARAAIKGSDR